MAEDADNPLDDELLKELGLEPRASIPKSPPTPAPAKPPPPAAPKVAHPSPAVPEKPKAPAPSVGQATPVKAPDPDASFSQGVKRVSDNLPIQVVAVLGKKNITLKELLALKPGEVVELKKLPQDTVDLVANGKLIARGELVLIDGKLGVQIKQLAG